MSIDHEEFGDLPEPIRAKVGKMQRQGFKTSDTEKIFEPKDLEIITSKMVNFSTRRDVLEYELDELAECCAIGLHLYKSQPIPDNAYALSSLINTYKGMLQTFERADDPRESMEEVERIIQKMFKQLIKALMEEINKTKIEFCSIYPDEKTTINDQFSRMISAVQPETQKLWEELGKELKKAFGIKG